MTEKSLKWVVSGGGPLLLLEKSLIIEWKGVELTDEDDNNDSLHAGAYTEGADELDDYERACKVNGYIGIISVGLGVGLVLGDAPLPTTWQPYQNGDGGLIIRWEYASDESSVIRSLSQLSNGSFVAEGFNFEVFSGNLLLFDTAYSGEDLDCLEKEDILEVQLSKGIYNVETASYKPDVETSLILHRLSKI
jgi:hypothetical protein